MNLQQFRLQGYYGNKYITRENNKSIMRTKLDTDGNEFQDFNYTIQGELKMGNKCLENNKTVSFKDCNGSHKQQWKYDSDNNTIKLKNNTTKCLTISDNNTNIEVRKCDKENDQIWAKEDLNDRDDVIGDWNNVSGKRVVLVESDNPWYVNKVNATPTKYKKLEYDELKTTKGKKLYNHGNAKSIFKINPNSPNLGYGHSFASRLGIPCNIEGFGEKKNPNEIIIIFIIVLILLVIYKL